MSKRLFLGAAIRLNQGARARPRSLSVDAEARAVRGARPEKHAHRRGLAVRTRPVPTLSQVNVDARHSIAAAI
jgi:hypothetical protein